MPRKSKKPVRKQTQSPTGEVVERGLRQVGQILLPMIAGIQTATKADLTEWLAGLRIGLPNQPSPEGDKEPPCQGNQRSQ